VPDPAVEHRRQQAAHPEVRVQQAPDVGDRVEELADAAVAEHLALDRDDDLVGRGQRVDRQQPEGRRAVQQDDVVRVPDRRQRRPQHLLALLGRQQHGLDAGEVDGGRQQVDAALEADRDVGGRDAVEEHVRHRLLDVLGIDAEGEREAGLGVEVDEEDRQPGVRERRPEGDDRRRLGHAALLVGDGDDAAHVAPPLRPACRWFERRPWTPAAGGHRAPGGVPGSRRYPSGLVVTPLRALPHPGAFAGFDLRAPAEPATLEG
jgi:hypothetical protein